MPTFNDPTADAEEARQALRGLAHATIRIDDPDRLYGIVGELLGSARSFEQSLIQMAGPASPIKAAPRMTTATAISARPTPGPPGRQPSAPGCCATRTCCCCRAADRPWAT